VISITKLAINEDKHFDCYVHTNTTSQPKSLNDKLGSHCIVTTKVFYSKQDHHANL